MALSINHEVPARSILTAKQLIEFLREHDGRIGVESITIQKPNDQYGGVLSIPVEIKLIITPKYST